ncbi:zinc finger BED domain-containing protein 5-like [Lycorma delicatula]|uniref:zinc finger BED domain-containing protein 5-like n=1 Tax=Lycorma delicatula TaxID=130591 RepID=UPI003F5167DD
MSEAKKKKRQYSVEYIKYGFIENSTNPSLPLCLLCSKTFSNEAMKPSRLQDHLNKMHPDKKDKNVAYLQDLEKKHNAQPSVSKLFSMAAKQDDDGLRASYNISLLIAQTGKPHTIGETLILPAIKEVITIVLHKPAADIIRKIPLSNSSVQRRIDEMAENIEKSLCNHLKTSKF